MRLIFNVYNLILTALNAYVQNTISIIHFQSANGVSQCNKDIKMIMFNERGGEKIYSYSHDDSFIMK